jgi:hypothetical protein
MTSAQLLSQSGAVAGGLFKHHVSSAPWSWKQIYPVSLAAAPLFPPSSDLQVQFGKLDLADPSSTFGVNFSPSQPPPAQALGLTSDPSLPNCYWYTVSGAHRVCKQPLGPPDCPFQLRCNIAARLSGVQISKCVSTASHPSVLFAWPWPMLDRPPQTCMVFWPP